METLDATQLSFKKLDEDNITWVTINGNHVPIPKGGTREQKARAIKEWFASKKKDVPVAKGKVSVYSARFEHDQPKRTAKRSGEGAQVHGDGQYTQRNIGINHRRYFDKFKRKFVSYEPDMNDEEMSSGFGKEMGKKFAEFMERGNGREDSYEVAAKKFKESFEKSTEQLKKFAKENGGDYSDLIQRNDRAIALMPKLKPEYFKTVANRYIIGDEPITNSEIQLILRKNMLEGWNKAPKEEDRQAALEVLRNDIANVRGGKKIAEQIKSWEDIKPAKAQMSVVRLPSNKYYIKENKKVYEQSPFVIRQFRDVCVDREIEYQTGHWNSSTPNNKAFVVDKFKEQYPDAYELLQKVYNRTVELEQKQARENTYIAIYTQVWDDVMETPQAKRIMQALPNKENAQQLELHDNVLTKEIRNPPANSFRFNPWNLTDEQREEYYKKKEEAEEAEEHGDLDRKDFETIAQHIISEVRNKINVSGRGMKKALMNAGIKGVSYFGGTDGWGNVTFDPQKDITVLKKITDPNEIRALVEKQRKKNPELYREKEE